MRRRRQAIAPRTVRPPRRLQHPRSGMTRERLTAELDAWAAGLAEHEHPPVILERVRLFELDGLVPLDWVALEAADAERRRERLARLEAEGAPLVGPDGGPR